MVSFKEAKAFLLRFEWTIRHNTLTLDPLNYKYTQ